MRNQVYWVDKEERAKTAKIHTEEMAKKYPDEIAKCVQKTRTYSNFPDTKEETPEFKGKPEISIYPIDSVSGIFNHGNGKTCVLNFASFKDPGGMFLIGSKAQEECLCHESFLYNVLKEKSDYYQKNKKNLNRGLYTNRALYSQDVRFERDGASINADVITCAAPNFYTAKNYCNVSPEENSDALRSRIRFVLSVMKQEGVETAILGAFGCGVFAQNPTEVAKIFKDEIEKVMVGRNFNAVFAVPKGNNPNYDKMREVFEEVNPRQHEHSTEAVIKEWKAAPKEERKKNIELER